MSCDSCKLLDYPIFKHLRLICYYRKAMCNMLQLLVNCFTILLQTGGIFTFTPFTKCYLTAKSSQIHPFKYLGKVNKLLNLLINLFGKLLYVYDKGRRFVRSSLFYPIPHLFGGLFPNITAAVPA